MIKADLHVHSRFSAHPSEWFLQRLGTRESYTSIETVYQTARQRGMRFVTITDHNQIEGSVALLEKYPDDVFTGLESTVYFPEDGCKIHVLVYGLNEKQFHEIEQVRTNIYDFRDYLKEQQLAHSVAHATFSVNKKLSEDHIYRLLLLFDYFETINGARTKRANNDFYNLLYHLTPDHISRLRKRYAIEPFSDDPWLKGLTGGSDDHSGLLIAKTFTSVREAATPREFLARLRKKESFARGAHNDYMQFAFSIYKIAYDFSKEKSSGIPATLFSTFNNMIFEGRPLGFRNRIAVARVKKQSQKNSAGSFQLHLSALLQEIEQMRDEPIDRKLDAVYDRLATLSDDLVKTSFATIADSLTVGDLSRVFRSVSGILPVMFLSLPFLSTISLLNESRRLQERVNKGLGIGNRRAGRRVLWFTDTITDLNGPSETIQKCAWMSFYQDLDLTPVVSLLPQEQKGMLPPNILNLPPVWSFTPHFFSLYTFRMPSLLGAIKKISEEEPDEIVISTPGPVGLLGLLCARLFHIPVKGIYHTDFSEQASFIIGDDSVSRLLEEYVRWFYSQCDTIKVPTKAYIDILELRGYSREKMSVFPRGIEPDLFSPVEYARDELELRHNIPKNGINLLYVGRISAEKQVGRIIQIYKRLCIQYSNINLIFVGTGPDPFFREFRESASALPGIHFLGRLPRNQLPVIYSGSDLMLFPSTTDTFGMVVLEAQACGLPVIVSDIGGPKEIVINGSTGFVLPAEDTESWIQTTSALVTSIDSFPEQYLEMRHAARNQVLSRFNWQLVLNDLFGLVDDNDNNVDDSTDRHCGSGPRNYCDVPGITKPRETTGV